MKRDRIIILIFVFLLLSEFLLAQSDTSYRFYNEYFEPAEASNAKFTGFLIRKNHKWEYTIVNSQRKIVLMKGEYADSGMQIKDGYFDFWFEDNTKKAEETYDKGKPTGIWKKWNMDGRLIDSSVYQNNGLRFRVNYSFYTNDSINMYSFQDLITKKTLVKYCYQEGGVKNEIEFLAGKEIERKDYYQSGQLKVHYKKTEKGKLLFVKRFTETGGEISEKEYKKLQKKSFTEYEETLRKHIPEFKSGNIGFQIYLNQYLKIPDRVIKENIYVDEIIIKFFLDETGRAYNIDIEGVNDAELKDVVIRFFERAPNWEMKGLKSYGPLKYKIKFIR